MAEKHSEDEQAKRKRKARSFGLDEELDMLQEEDIPAYQEALKRVVREYQANPITAGLTPHAIALAVVSMDTRVKCQVKTWCRVAGVNMSTYYEWWRDERWLAFREYLARNVAPKDLLSDIFAAISKGVKAGDPRLVRLASEINGLLVAPSGNENKAESPEERMKRLRAQQAVSEENASS